MLRLFSSQIIDVQSSNVLHLTRETIWYNVTIYERVLKFKLCPCEIKSPNNFGLLQVKNIFWMLCIEMNLQRLL